MHRIAEKFIIHKGTNTFLQKIDFHSGVRNRFDNTPDGVKPKVNVLDWLTSFASPTFYLFSRHTLTWYTLLRLPPSKGSMDIYYEHSQTSIFHISPSLSILFRISFYFSALISIIPSIDTLYPSDYLLYPRGLVSPVVFYCCHCTVVIDCSSAKKSPLCPLYLEYTNIDIYEYSLCQLLERIQVSL